MKAISYCHPISPEGRAEIVEAPPWHYGADILLVQFRADEAEVRRCLPPELEVGEEPDLAFAWIADIVSVGENGRDLLGTNPERTQYREGLIALSCKFGGVSGFFHPYVWVDQDFSLMRGWFLGFPKKLGKVYMTRIHRMNPLINSLMGSRLMGFVERHGNRIMTAELKITEKVEDKILPKLGNTYNVRHFPDVGSTRPLLHDLVNVRAQNVRFGAVWRGDADLAFGSSENEEVARLGPEKIDVGYYYEVGWTNVGVDRVRDLLEQNSTA